MMKYEIHLPLAYGDGERIEEYKIRQVREELIAAFGAFVVPDRKTWRYDRMGQVDIMRIEILTVDDRVAKGFFRGFKERAKKSLHQTDILITTHRIQST